MDYETLDYLPNLSLADRSNADLIRFVPDLTTENNGYWNNIAQKTRDDSEQKNKNSIFTINLTEGNTYNFTSYNRLDPIMLRLFDSSGTTLAIENNRQVDGFDLISDYVAPYTGTYYIDASWGQIDWWHAPLFLIRVEENIYLSGESGQSFSVNPNYIPEYSYTKNAESIPSFSYTDTDEQLNTQDNYLDLISENSNFLLGGLSSGFNLNGLEPNLNYANYINTVYYFNHSLSDVTITSLASSNEQLSKVITFQNGEDITSNVERLSFKDTTIAIDLDSNQRAGSTLALLYAAFDTLPDEDDFGYWISKSDSIQDLNSKNGTPRIETLADSMIDYYAPNGISNEALVNLLFQNIVGKEPTTTETATFVEQIDNGTYTQASFFAMAAETDLNQEQYAELIGQGLAYNEYDSKAG